jgi:hypothetical protein
MMKRDPRWLYLTLEALLVSHLVEGGAQSFCFAFAAFAITMDTVTNWLAQRAER